MERGRNGNRNDVVSNIKTIMRRKAGTGVNGLHSVPIFFLQTSGKIIGTRGL